MADFPELVRLGAGELDHLAPLLGLISDELPEVGGRAGKRSAAHVGNPRVDLRVGETRVDFLVEHVDDFNGRVFRRADTLPRARLVPDTKSPTVGRSGSNSERLALVTASGRSLPALTYSMDAGMVPNIACTCPASMSVRAGASPRYGTCTTLRPVSSLNSSPDRWPAVPLPPEAMLTLPGLALA
jgi:hypothetical protein